MTKELTPGQWGRLWTLASAANLDAEIVEYCLERRNGGYKAEHEAADAKCKAGTCTDNELIYAATTRCRCGAGMAYHKGIGPFGYWDCSDILTGRAPAKDAPGAVIHDARLEFTLYEVKSENQPSQEGRTTRLRSEAEAKLAEKIEAERTMMANAPRGIGYAYAWDNLYNSDDETERCRIIRERRAGGYIQSHYETAFYVRDEFIAKRTVGALNARG